jgi:hypothetical protein
MGKSLPQVKWDDLWRPFAKTPLTSTSSTSLQIFVKHGELLLGKLEKVGRRAEGGGARAGGHESEETLLSQVR